MLIHSIAGDILVADAEALVNPVNTVGVMGKGLALQFCERWPKMFAEYRSLCRRKELSVGTLHVYRTETENNPHFIINFPTKKHWRGRSEMEFILSGLKALRQTVVELNIKSLAIPQLGCGLGGLQWQEVRPQIIRTLEGIPNLAVYLYER